MLVVPAVRRSCPAAARFSLKVPSSALAVISLLVILPPPDMVTSSIDCTRAPATGCPCAVSTRPVTLIPAGITRSTLRRSVLSSLATARPWPKLALSISALADRRYCPGNIPSRA